MKQTIDLLFTLVSPLHITDPGQVYYNPDTRRLTAGQTAFPCSRTKTIPLPAARIERAAAGAGGEEAEDTKRQTVPYIPGNTLRGGLRRAAARLLNEALEKRGEQVSFDLQHILLCGSASASPDGFCAVTEAVAAAKHPFAGLFGGGSKLIWGRSSIANAYPVTAATIEAGLVPESYAEHSPASGWLTTVLTYAKVDDFLRGTARVPTVVANFAEEIQKWTAALAASREKRDSKDANSKKLGLATVFAKEVVIPGAKFHSSHQLDTEFAGPAMLGLYIVALARFANEQRLGGGWREGLGRFALSASLRDGNGGVEILTTQGDEYAPNTAVPAVAQAVAAWQEFAETVTARSLDEVFSVKPAKAVA